MSGDITFHIDNLDLDSPSDPPIPSNVPQEIRDKLLELQLELSEGDITEKGYQKKRTRLLQPYLTNAGASHGDDGRKENRRKSRKDSESSQQSSVSGSSSKIPMPVHHGHGNSSAAQRRLRRRATRNDNRHISEIRIAEVQEAIDKYGAEREPIPMPNRRISQLQPNKPQPRPARVAAPVSDSSSDDESISTPNEDSSFVSNSSSKHSTSASAAAGGVVPKIGVSKASSHLTPTTHTTTSSTHLVPSTTPATSFSAGLPLTTSSKLPMQSTSASTSKQPQIRAFNDWAMGLPDVNAEDIRSGGGGGNYKTGFSAQQQQQQPPDITSDTSSAITSSDATSRIQAQIHSHVSSIRGFSGIDPSLEGRPLGKVSAKIQQLLNTLKRPKKVPIYEYFKEDDEGLLKPQLDPKAPKPERDFIKPVQGETLAIPAKFPRNLCEALQRYALSHPKSLAFSVIGQHNKTVSSITYGKLLQKVAKVGFSLIKGGVGGGSKQSTIGGRFNLGDKIGLCFPNTDPISFSVAFYASLLAGLIPVPIDVPISKRDASTQSVGFLLDSLGVKVVLTNVTCLYGLPHSHSGHVIAFKGWPRVEWLTLEQLNKSPPAKDPNSWITERPDSEISYIEYKTDQEGTVLGINNLLANMYNHSRALSAALSYEEFETLVCLLDFKRESGLSHAVITGILKGMHVIFVPYSHMKVDPTSWLKVITQTKASTALAKSRDMYWALQAVRDHEELNLSSIRLLLVVDGANPWSLMSCEQFLKVFKPKGMRPEALCPCAVSQQGQTVAARRPGARNTSATVRGVLSISALSYGVIRAEQEGSFNSMTMQDCGQVLPGANLIAVRIYGEPIVCHADEVGEICIASSYAASAFFNLPGRSKSTFDMRVTYIDGRPVSEERYVRTGLLGFFHKSTNVSGDLIFICGQKDGLMNVSGRRHNTDDVIATALAVEPQKFIYRGRIAVFSQEVLKDGRIIIIAEQRMDKAEEDSFDWMSRVLQAIDTIHQVPVYCLALVAPNVLPRVS